MINVAFLILNNTAFIQTHFYCLMNFHLNDKTLFTVLNTTKLGKFLHHWLKQVFYIKSVQKCSQNISVLLLNIHRIWQTQCLCEIFMQTGLISNRIRCYWSIAISSHRQCEQWGLRLNVLTLLTSPAMSPQHIYTLFVRSNAVKAAFSSVVCI